MADMISDLDRIVEHLRRLGRRTPGLLLDGLSGPDLESWEAAFPFAFTRELDRIYQWRNGTKAEEGDLLEALHFFPGFYFLSIEEAVQTYRERERSPQWRKAWFPLFADGGGDFYVVPCLGEKTDASEIIGFIHGEPEQIVEYESLSAMIATFESCFAEGAFFVDDDDTMEIDDDKHRDIAHRFNPEVPEWQS